MSKQYSFAIKETRESYRVYVPVNREVLESMTIKGDGVFQLFFLLKQGERYEKRFFLSKLQCYLPSI